MPVDYASILNSGMKPQESPEEAYQNAVKARQQKEEHQQTTAYRAAETTAAQARAQLTNTENDQKQRALQAAQFLGDTITKHTKYDPNTGQRSVNFVGVHQDVDASPYKDLGLQVDDQAFKLLKDETEGAKLRATTLGRHFNSVQTPDWNDQSSVQQAGQQYLKAINDAVTDGALPEPAAVPLRAAAANYNPQVDAQRQQVLLQGIPTVLEQADFAGKTVSNLHNMRMAGPQEAEANAKAQEAQLGVLDKTSSAGAPPPGGYPVSGSASGPYTTAPAGGYPVQNVPAAGAPAQTVPQNAPAPTNPNSPAEIDLGYGIPPKPATPPPPAAGTPAQTVPAGQATAPVRTAPQAGTPQTQADADAATRQFYQDHPDRRPLDEKPDGINLPTPGPVTKLGKWTQEQLDAYRNDPSFSGIKGSIPAKPGPAADAIMAKLGLTREQQIQNEDREAKAAAGGDKLKTASRDLGALLEQGIVKYARAWDKLDPELQKALPNPENYDPKKADEFARQVRVFGMTPSEQERPKGGGVKPPTPGQLNTIESQKNSALGKAKNDFHKATATVLGKAKVDQHLSDLREATQNTQNEYENKLRQFGLEVGHFEYPAASEWDKAGFPKSGANAVARPAAPKTATIDQVRAYARKFNVSEEDARKKAEDEGIQIK